jgi:signal transduction histidine kinase
LVQQEKMASLGGLVAGVAHEINTPVGVGVTAASHLQQEVRALSKAVQDNTLSKPRFEQALHTFEQVSDIILLNLTRAADLINSFKRVAVDQSSDERRRVNLKDYIEEVLLSLKPKLKTTKHRVELDCADDIDTVTTPGALSQILTNLVVNSIIHAFEPDASGLMTIRVRREGEHIELKFSDDGRGIPTDHIARIFDPFFTTRRGQGGTGLGLHIVFNLVHQNLGGTIQVDSAPGHGTTFIIRF